MLCHLVSSESQEVRTRTPPWWLLARVELHPAAFEPAFTIGTCHNPSPADAVQAEDLRHRVGDDLLHWSVGARNGMRACAIFRPSDEAGNERVGSGSFGLRKNPDRTVSFWQRRTTTLRREQTIGTCMGDDQRRFTEMYQRTHSMVLAYACRRAGYDDAREATDEAYLIAWRKFDAVPVDPIPWLIVTVRNNLSDLYRRGKRQDVLFDRLVDARTALGPTGHEGADVAALERVAVLEAVTSLSDSDREVLLLTVWDGLSHRQASTVVGCSPATFAVRHHRARRRLEIALTESSATGGQPKSPSAERNRL
jgi:RNA polymerase sigma factor (sigma-70 family)